MSLDSPIVRAGLRVEMPDGVRLATDVYRPRHGRPVPAVLLRTYLGKARHLDEGVAWAREGFACVVQDVRGRYDSDGTWEPYAREREDGAASAAWVAEQPWCDGQVAVTGGSYAAFTAWAAALESPAVRAAVVAVPAMRPVNFEPGGVLKLFNHASWWMSHGDTRTERTRLFEAMRSACPGLLARLPVADLPRCFWADLPGWFPGVEAGPDAPPPIQDSELARLDLPVLHVGGWHDPFISQTFHQHETTGSAVEPRPRRELIVGPWTHELRSHEPAAYGERVYGSPSRLPLGRLQARFLRGVLIADHPAPPDTKPRPAARLFLTGANRWLEGDGWPPVPVSQRSWFAASGGRLEEKGGASGSMSFLYDPLDPYPARTGPVDQSDLLRRRDTVCFTSAPLTAPLTWIGAPRVILHAATDAPGTDWVARLHEVLPDGRSLYLGHGLVDAARELRRAGDPLVPGEAHRVEIPLPPLAITIPAGHRLRLEITSSSFPEHARNLNTGADRYTSTETRVARQTVLWGELTPTALVLPVTEDLS